MYTSSVFFSAFSQDLAIAIFTAISNVGVQGQANKRNY